MAGHIVELSVGGGSGVMFLLLLWRLSAGVSAEVRARWTARGRWLAVPSVVLGTLLTQAAPTVQAFAIGFVVAFLVAGWVVALISRATTRWD